MVDNCRKTKDAKLVLCDAANSATTNGFIRLQHMRNFDTNKLRERLSIVKGKQLAPLRYCPWCRANIDTQPKETNT